MSGKRRAAKAAAQSTRADRSAAAAHDGRAWLVSAGLIALVALIYSPVASHGFVNWDDPEYVSDNRVVAGGLTWTGIVWAFNGAHSANWHPVTWLSHMLDAQLFGVSAGPHHIVNVVLHVANTLLLFGWLFKVTGAMGRSGVVAALFAAHPLHVESVAWISERKDRLSTLFWMLTMWAYLAYVRRPSLARHAVIVVGLALGLMAKPMVVTLPFVLLLLDIWPLRRVELGKFSDTDRRTWTRLLGEKIPLFALALASAVITFIAQSQGGAVQRVASYPIGLRIANAVVSYVAYVAAGIWPTGMTVVYPLRATPPLWMVGAAVITLIVITTVAIRLAVRRPYLLIGWLWYLGTLVPVIGLVQVGSQLVADRYTYVPFIGLFIIVAWAVSDVVDRVPAWRLAAPLAGSVAVVAYALIARAQVQYWRDDFSLWSHALAVARENYRAHNNLATALSSRGAIPEAIAHYREAIRIRSDFGEAHSNLANALVRQGNVEEAAREYRAALAVHPNDPFAHNGLGSVLDEQGQLAEAIGHYTEALRFAPEMAEAHNNLGTALAKQGRIDDAIREFLEASRLKPAQGDFHYNLGVMYTQRGNVNEARRHFEMALAIDPTSTNARRGLEGVKQK
jgi:Flp pilus assembly protein TadD